MAGRKSIAIVDLVVEHLDDERIVDRLMADRSGLAVTRIDLRLVAQRQQLLENRTHDPRIIAARQIGSADAFAEKRIARKHGLRLRLVERDVARSMARSRQYPEPRITEPDLLRSVEVPVDRRHPTDLDAEYRTAHFGGFEQEPVLARKSERNTEPLLEERDAHHMVEMAVGIERQDRGQIARKNELFQTGVFPVIGISGVDHHALPGIVPDDIGVFADGIEC